MFYSNTESVLFCEYMNTINQIVCMNYIILATWLFTVHHYFSQAVSFTGILDGILAQLNWAIDCPSVKLSRKCLVNGPLYQTTKFSCTIALNFLSLGERGLIAINNVIFIVEYNVQKFQEKFCNIFKCQTLFKFACKQLPILV